MRLVSSPTSCPFRVRSMFLNSEKYFELESQMLNRFRVREMRNIWCLSMEIASERMLRSETGSPEIITSLWAGPAERSRSYFSEQKSREISEAGGQFLWSIPPLFGWPHFPFPENLLQAVAPKKS